MPLPSSTIPLQISYRPNSPQHSVTGQCVDSGTDLYWYHSRWYDPSLGRFLQPDTIVPEPGNPQSLNRYSYVNNRPTVFVDPTGYRLEEGAGFPVCGGIGCIYPVGHPLAGYLIGTTQEDVAQAKVEMKAAGEVVVGILWEPADWALTANHWRQGDFHVLDLAGLLPFVPATGIRALRHADEVYGGVRQASRFLQDQGVSRRYRKQIIESFDIETIKVRPASPDEFGIRYYDNVDASAKSRYLFDTFPASRESLAIKPEWNEMTEFRQWQIRPGTTIIEGRAAPQGRYSGGALQKFVLFLKDLLQ